MVNEETLKRTPPEVLEYLRFLRRRIQELEATEPQRRIEELEAQLAKAEASAASHRADFERERERCERLTLELIRAAVETMNAKEAAARLEGELAARRSRPWWKWLAGGANWLRRRECHVPSAA